MYQIRLNMTNIGNLHQKLETNLVLQ